MAGIFVTPLPSMLHQCNVTSMLHQCNVTSMQCYIRLSLHCFTYLPFPPVQTASDGSPSRSVRTQCRTLWPEQHFSTTSHQNNAMDNVSKIKFPNLLCMLVSFWLICTTQIKGLENFLKLISTHKHDLYSNVNIPPGKSRKTYSL